MAHDLGGTATFYRQQDDRRPPDMLLRAIPIRHDRRKALAIYVGYLRGDARRSLAVSHQGIDASHGPTGSESQGFGTKARPLKDWAFSVA